jgi:hypothetical protein
MTNDELFALVVLMERDVPEVVRLSELNDASTAGVLMRDVGDAYSTLYSWGAPEGVTNEYIDELRQRAADAWGEALARRDGYAALAEQEAAQKASADAARAQQDAEAAIKAEAEAKAKEAAAIARKLAEKEFPQNAPGRFSGGRGAEMARRDQEAYESRQQWLGRDE